MVFLTGTTIFAIQLLSTRDISLGNQALKGYVIGFEQWYIISQNSKVKRYRFIRFSFYNT